jgi:nitrogen fixation protein NifU and related proteins
MPGLEDLYREVILDHYRSPRNKGQLESPPATRAEGFNPLCGDEIVVYLMMDGDTVVDVKIGGQGCSISQASASMMSAAIKGKSIDEARGLIVSFEELMGIKEAHDHAGDGSLVGEPPTRLGDLAALTGVKKFPVRIKCATLAWYTLVDALNQVSPAS